MTINPSILNVPHGEDAPTIDPDTLKTAADFHAYYAAIPDEKWCTEVFRSFTTNRCCARGWLCVGSNFVSAGELQQRWEAADARLTKIAGSLWEHVPLSTFDAWYSTVAGVNDGRMKRYNQTTPRARILAFLEEAMNSGL